MISSLNHLHAFAALALAAAGGFVPLSSAAVDLSVSDCAGLADLAVDQMTEDVNLFLDDSVTFACDAVSISPAAYIHICIYIYRSCARGVRPGAAALYKHLSIVHGLASEKCARVLHALHAFVRHANTHTKLALFLKLERFPNQDIMHGFASCACVSVNARIVPSCEQSVNEFARVVYVGQRSRTTRGSTSIRRPWE